MNPGVVAKDDDALSELSPMAENSTEALPLPLPLPSRSPNPKIQLPHALLPAAAPGEPFDRSPPSVEAEKKSRSSGKDGGPLDRSSGSWKDRRAAARIPFHIASIPKPQDQFGMLVNNSNRPFMHVWLERSPDGCRLIHPLERLSVLDFVDRNFGEGEQMKPLPVEGAPFKLVEVVKELKALASKLQDVNEFAVDLEHNQYRSFQGLTCLMQISTRTEDFVIDTLKLRVHVGPYLREVFKDPSKRKVMHGADRDILWLQRDFGIYVCNLFDTGQASRLMKLERNSLEYLLHHFCDIDANKEYQTADWRLRPLPGEMLKYAREDTHYLLYIYDQMRKWLVSESPNESGDDLLIEVYKRSYDICMQLYERELLTDGSYLSVYGLQEADFNSQQLAIVSGLYEWRDHVARAEDESTGYILPNKALLEIAKQMPLSVRTLCPLMKSKKPSVEHHLSTVIEIIKTSMQNAAAFENVSEQLKKGRQQVEKIGSKLEQIKSSATLPYHPFFGHGHREPCFMENVRHQYPEMLLQSFNWQAGTSGLEVVTREHERYNSQPFPGIPAADGSDSAFLVPCLPGHGCYEVFQQKSDEPKGPIAVSNLSSSFTEFFKPVNETGNLQQDRRTHLETYKYPRFKPFDYDTARKQ